MTIYYLQVNDTLGAGGLAQAYRHVRFLAEAGHDARILFLDPKDRPSQPVPFAYLPGSALRRAIGRLPVLGHRLHNRRIMALPVIANAQPGLRINHVLPGGGIEKRTLQMTDVVVLPEFLGLELRASPTSVPAVVLNQGPHLSFQLSPKIPVPRIIYQDPILGVITVSAHAERYLRTGFPNLRTHVVRNAVDATLFQYTPEKKKQIAFMPRKLREDLQQVLSLLSMRGALDGWTLCPIEGVGPARAAEIMRESAVFLSTLAQEGFGLPPLEAALCGCVVVGYTGFAAAEFMDPAYCFPVPESDVLAFVQILEGVLRALDADPKCYSQRNEVFAASLRDRYSEERQRTALLAAWSAILQR